MANSNEGSYNLNIDVNSNTGPAIQGFYELGALTKQMRTDISAIDSGMAGIGERADNLTKFFNQNFDVLSKMATVLERIQALVQSNQTNFSNNINSLNEMMNSTRALGGNMSHVMGMLGAANGGGGGGDIYPMTASQDFSNSYDEERRGIYGEVRRGGGGGGGGGGRRAGRGFGDDDDDDYDPSELSDEDPTNAGRTKRARFGRVQRQNPRSAARKNAIRSHLKKYPQVTPPPPGREHKAAEYAYKDMMDQISSVTDALPFGIGKTIAKRAQDLLKHKGIDLDSIRKEQAADTEYDPKTGAYTRKSGIKTGSVEDQALKAANTVAKIFTSNLVQGFTKFAGYAGQIGAAYGAVADVASNIRQYTAMGQAMGGVTGQVDYGRSIGQGISAFFKSDMNLNPFYSSQDVMQNQIMGSQLGLKGGYLTNYTNKGIQFQTDYGLTAQQSQAILGTGLAAGVTVNQNADAFGKVRNLENNTTTSTAYGNQAYQQGMTTYAGMGAQGAVAASMGVSAARFGAGDLVAQAAGFTGQEGAGSMFGNALMSQQLGVSYTGLYAATRGASASKLSRAQNATHEEILGYAGIDTETTYKDENDFLNQNQDKIMVLQMILQSLVQQGSKDYESAASSPQKAAKWAWLTVKQKQRFDKAGTGSTGVTAKGVKKAMDATVKKTGRPMFIRGTSPETIAANTASTINSQLTSAYNAYSANPTAANLKAYQQWQAAAGENHGTVDNGKPTNVVISIHPKHAHILAAAVKVGTQGFNNGKVAPNVQPTKSS